MDFPGLDARQHRHNIFLSSLFLNLVLQVKASSKALIVRVRLGFVCGILRVRNVTRVTEYICKEHVYNKDRRKATSESNYNILSISFPFLPFVTITIYLRLSRRTLHVVYEKIVERERTPESIGGGSAESTELKESSARFRSEPGLF